MNVVDSLVVTLGLDAAHFRAGHVKVGEDLKKTKNDANAAAKEISASGKQAAEFFGRIRNEALSLAAVFLGGMGIKALVQNLTTTDAELGRLSRNLGIAPEKLSAWQAVVERAGGTAEGFTATIQGLNDAYQTYLQTGTVPHGNILTRFGIVPADLKDSLGLLNKIADAASKMPDRQAAISYMKQLGFDDGTINVSLLQAGERRKQLEEAERLGVAHKKDTDAAERLQAAFRKTQQAVTDVAREILTNLTPRLVEVLKAVNDWLGNGENRKWLGEEIARIGEGIKSFLTGVNDVVTALGGWKTVSEALLGMWAVSKVAGMSAGIIRLLTLLAAVPGSGVTAATLGSLGILALPLALKGDSGPNSGGVSPEQEAINRQKAIDSGALTPGQFWARNAPTWLGGDGPGPARAGPRSSGGGGGPMLPAVPYKAGDILTNTGATAAQYAAFKEAVAGIESHGRYDIMGGSSNRFAGRYQLGSQEITDTARRLFVPRPTQAQFLADPAMQERFFEAYTDAHHQQLMRTSAIYRGMSPAQRLAVLGYAHNQGAGGASAWLRTGVVGHDAFHTGGDAYVRAVQKAIGGGTHATVSDFGPATPRGRYDASGRYLGPLPGEGPLIDPSLIPQRGWHGPSAGGDATTNTSQSETHIGAIAISLPNVHDADGLARGLGPAFSRFGLVAQANTGLA